MEVKSIGREKAIELAQSGWWKDKTADEIVQVQLFTEELCMDWNPFHEAVETVLGRGVWTHEFAFADSLRKEYLGERKSPSMQEIYDLISEAKRISVSI